MSATMVRSAPLLPIDTSLAKEVSLADERFQRIDVDPLSEGLAPDPYRDFELSAALIELYTHGNKNDFGVMECTVRSGEASSTFDGKVRIGLTENSRELDKSRGIWLQYLPTCDIKDPAIHVMTSDVVFDFTYGVTYYNFPKGKPLHELLKVLVDG